MRKFIYALGTVAMMAVAFASCEDETDTIPTGDDKDTTKSGPYIYNEESNMFGLYSIVTEENKPVAFTLQDIWIKMKGEDKEMSIEIPTLSYNGTTVPGFIIDKVETIDKNTFAKDFNVKDTIGGTHSGSIKYVNTDTSISITMSEKYSEINKELKFDFYPNMAQMTAGTYSGSFTYAAEGMKDTTINASVKLGLTTLKVQNVTLPEMKIVSEGDTIKVGPFSMDTRLEYGEKQIAISNKETEGNKDAEITIQGTYTPDGKLSITFEAKPQGTSLTVKGSFSNN